jgi:hypothetical protein
MKTRRNNRRRSERPPSAASLESGHIVVMMMVVMVVVVVVVVMTMVVVAPLRRRRFFRRGLGRRRWRGAGLRRGGDRGESDSGGHKHSHENFIHHFYLLRDSSNPRQARQTQDRKAQLYLLLVANYTPGSEST